MERLLQDLRFGLRSLGKHRGFTALAVITLTLGIGANTAVFSMVNALLLRPYPFRDLERLVLILRAGNNSGSETRVAPADLMELQQQKKMFESVSAFQYKLWNITEAGETEGVVACAVQSNFFDVIGMRAALGRTLLPEEGTPGRDQVALVNHGYWKRRFGADPNVIGRTVTMNGRNYTIIGVMPADLQYPRAADFWIPLAFIPREAAEYNEQSLHLLARLRPGASIEQGQAELHGAIARLKQLYPNVYQNRDLTLLRLRDEQFALLGVPFLMLQASAIFVLLLASVNLVNLLFARLVGRQKEVAIRATLGASRARLGQLFSSETVPLALLAGAIALAGSAWSVEFIRDSINPNYTKWVAGWERIQVDERVLGFALILTALIGVLFGIGAAWRSGRLDLNDVLKQSGARNSSASGRQRLRSTLVVVQMVFATVLLVGAALMAKGFQHLTDIYQSLDPHAVLTMRISLPEQKYPDDAQVRLYYQGLLLELAAVPGVQAAGMIANAPASNVDNPKTPFMIEGRPLPPGTDPPSVDLQSVSPDYFRAVRIPLMEGRAVSDQDGPDAPRVAVISRTLARQFWGDASPIGQRIKIGKPDAAAPWIRIVGVLDDVKQNWWDNGPRPVVYLSYLQAPRRTMEFGIRTAGEPLAIASAVRGALRRVDPNVSAGEGVNTLEGSIADALAPLRILGSLMITFSTIALVLAALGVYGILAHSVAQRKQEFGIRLALGAERADLLRLVLAQACKLAGIGIAIGLPLAYVLTRVVGSLLHGIIAFNAGVFVVLAIALTGVALIAAYIPASRAFRVDPTQTLRSE